MKKFANRSMALVLTIVMVIGMLTLGASAAATDSFTDVSGSPYAEAINALAGAGIMKGVGSGKFAPDMAVSRAMAITVLGRMARVEPKETSMFSDVVNGSWYSGYVGWAEQNGIVLGDGQGHYFPDRAVTGEEMELILTRYTEMAGIAYTAGNTSKEPLTRGELAQMVYSVYELATVRTTAYGSVQGYIEESGALVWKGIPYGHADRWERPEAPAAWSGVRDCTSYGDSAIQISSNWATGETTLKGSEDCLNLDVYAPEGAKDLPVLVYIHGGNNQTGDTTNELKGQDLVFTNNCVFVTINYRLGLFGFNPLPALKTGEDAELDSGNYALLDIAYALDWVKANIAAFGGNPDNVTISGHSAGGRDVMATLISPLFKGKFNQAIAFSGGMTVADEEMSALQVADKMAALAVEDGKAADQTAAVQWLLTDSAEVAEYLKSIPADRLAGVFGDAGIHMALFPHLFTDGTVLPEDGFDTTEYNSVPVLLFTGKDEFFFFKNYGYLLSDEFRALDDETRAAADVFAEKYGSYMYGIFNGQESANTMYGNYDAPIYVCQYDYDIGGMNRAYHGVFQSLLAKSGAMVDTSTDGFKEMSAIFNSYLTNFLHTGSPNSNGLDEWKKWDPKTHLTMVFDADETTGTAVLKDIYMSYQDIINEMKADTTISEAIKTEIINTVLNGRWFSAAQDAAFNAPSLWVADRAGQ